MSELVIRQIPVLKDNYVYLIHEPQSRATGVVDPSVAAPILEAAEREGWRITHILNTHHHNDHTGGNREIKEATGCIIVAACVDDSPNCIGPCQKSDARSCRMSNG